MLSKFFLDRPVFAWVIAIIIMAGGGLATLRRLYELAREMQVDVGTLRHKIEELHEFNPMLGHRGCRLAITFPEIYDMQVMAIIEAAIRDSGIVVKCVEGQARP